ncbi:MAG: inositol-3-phosphate synthase [Cyclobacteriaceae bacterium]|nr:inositol-3-phosphate synthase [Cyclobacteriaceae bacterium HetDA_MAG_MS6]
MIKVAIVGIGNCCSSLLQGIEYYKNESNTSGFVQYAIKDYRIGDVKVVGAIDVDKRKIGKDISEAIFTSPNRARKFADVPSQGVPVVKGPVLDGVAQHMHDSFQVDDSQQTEDIAAYLKRVEAEFLVCYLPVGSEEAVKFYASEAIKAGVGFLNAIPVFICSTQEWSDKFKDAGLVCAGDDIKSQFGATYLNRILVENFQKRGFHIDNLYQLNVGGNTDFENMIDESRLISKRISKSSAVNTLFAEGEAPKLRIGPSDFVPHLNDTKICYINVNGTQFGDQPYELELKLKVEDSPNSAGVMLDVIRLAKVGKDKGMTGNISVASSFGFKSPMDKRRETEISQLLEEFLG